MSADEEFIQWLNRPEKSFKENFSFAIKAWKSSELPMSTKYERVLEWLSGKNKQLGRTTSDFQKELMNEFLQLRCPPSLINLDIKRKFIEGIVKWCKNWKDQKSRLNVEVLFDITTLEMMQDLFRTEYEMYAKILGQLFKSYETYLRQSEEVLVCFESEFFGKVMGSVKSWTKKAGNQNEFERKFTEFALQQLIEIVIVFQDKGINFFDDFLELLRSMFTDYVEQDLLQRFLKLPIHVNLLAFECAIENYRGDVKFFQELVQVIFGSLLEGEMSQGPSLALTIGAYTLEMFRKHDILLSFPITPEQNAIEFFGEKITWYVNHFMEDHLLEVLSLLCATLRLNPLILEKSVLGITVKVMVAKKSDKEQAVFEEFMVLLMTMFRKLSRAEKFVSNLQKSIWEHLKTVTVPKKIKRKRTLTDPPEDIKKKKLKFEDGEEVADTPSIPENNFYLEILFRDFHQRSEPESKTQAGRSFPYITFAWPSDTVGIAFSKLVMGLMSKPSLVIWKSLIYALKELIQSATTLDDNALFLFDFYSSLLCQFFSGCKLPEQADKFWAEIEANRQITSATLHELGHFLLSQEHNNRTMNAFLECCYHVGQFDLLLWYYRPDFMTNDEEFRKSSKNLHGYLSQDEWVLIQQRIINFGRVECKFNANRLLLQQLKACMLFQSKKHVHLHKFMLASPDSDFEQTKLIFSNSPGGSWLLPYINLKEKEELCGLLVQELDHEMIGKFAEEMESLEMITLGLYKKLGSLFEESKKAILHGLDFNAEVELIAKSVMEKKSEYSVKKVEAKSVREVLDVMSKLPIGCCRKDKKMIFFAIHLALYRDLIAAGEEELAQKAFNMLTDILHFGEKIHIFNYFPIEWLVNVIPPSQALELYEFIFSNLHHDIAEFVKFMETIQQILTDNQLQLTDDHVTLLLLSIETLSKGTVQKKQKKFRESFLDIFKSHVFAFFAETEGRKQKKDKKFVEKTLPGFVVYANLMPYKSKAVEADLNEDFRRICKIYIGYSMDCHNAHAIKLITTALDQRTILHFDQDEIEFVLNSYWNQLSDDLKASKLDEKTAESVIKIIIRNKTNEDLLLTLKKIGKNIAREDFGYTCRLLALIAKCPFCGIKGAIFNEHFKLITLDMVLRLEKDDQCQPISYETIFSLLQCQKAIAENTKIPMSYDTLDDILAFLMDLNVKKFPVGDTNVGIFNKLHLEMNELCTALLKHRHLILMDRVPQFVHIFKDLLQAICWYKSDRQKDTALTSGEVDSLAELALKMESLMHLVASHSLEVKRVAPYVLTFTINLMVSSKRPTTLYPKIKTHIENICYDLVAVCDHRVGRFILRCSNEAARQVYETLAKDHKKYHKFKGKV